MSKKRVQASEASDMAFTSTYLELIRKASPLAHSDGRGVGGEGGWGENLGNRKDLMYPFEQGEPSAVRHRAMIELPYFLRTRLLTQLGSLDFRDKFRVHFFCSADFILITAKNARRMFNALRDHETTIEQAPQAMLKRDFKKHSARSTFIVAFIVAFTILVQPIVQRSASAQAVTVEAVNQAIDRATDYLRQSQNIKSGRWPGQEAYGCGQTALVVLALMNAGLSPEDRTVASGLDFLKQTNSQKTYEVALQTMAFVAADPEQYTRQIRRNVEWLMDAQVKQGPEKGGWWYQNDGIGSDPSNTQFGVLALWEAQRSQIVKVPDAMKLAAQYWMNRQNGNPQNFNFGAWRYSGDEFSGSMTCAGIASLIMAEDALELLDVDIKGEKIVCCGEREEISRAELGFRWLERNYQIATNPGSGNWWFYYLYGLERVGRLTGQRFIGNHDWYREGCELLIKRQDRLRGFISEGSGDNVTDTALALLFLSKGKRKVVLGRLDSSTGDTASQPRHAVQHLTGHIEDAWKKELTWQSFSLERSSLEDLLEAPILFWSGRQAVKLDDRSKKMLREYVEQGGFLFAEARNGDGCNGEAFEKSFRALIEEIFEAPLQKLAPDHPIWYAESPVDLQAMPKDFWLYGLETCCRTGIVYSPTGLSCRWEVHRPDGFSFAGLLPVLKQQCEAASLLGVNIATYATGRELKEKLDRIEVVRTTQESRPFVRSMIRLPRLLHSGGAEDTPRAVTTAMEVFRRERSSLAAVESPLIAAEPKALEEPPVVYLSGRRTFRFSDEEKKHLRTFFENGGMVIGDAVCASEEFNAAVHKQLVEVLPGAIWTKVASDHPMLTTEYQGYDVRRVTIVNPGTPVLGQAVQLQRYEGPPALEMLTWKDQVVAVFSPLDLSCALESRQAAQCRGYIRADAAKIAINMMMFFLLE
jgi:hypothetical protein